LAERLRDPQASRCRVHLQMCDRANSRDRDPIEDGRPRVLTILDHYLPGYKAGGPIRTIRSLVARLGTEFAFHIVTADRDLGDRVPYAGRSPGAWYRDGDARVMYRTRIERTLPGWAALLRSLDYDVLYLNSLFSRSSMKIMLLRWLRVVPRRPLVVAPRGELQEGALSLHRRRKAAFLRFARAVDLYRGAVWQASTAREAEGIRKAMLRGLATTRDIAVHATPHFLPVTVAADLVPVAGADMQPSQARRKRAGEARLVFLSRISPMKNLDYALRVIQEVEGEVAFDIYGPIGDQRHWAECCELLQRLPPRVVARYRGSVPPPAVQETYARYHALFLPTRGENFGHAIVEAFLAGCVVLTSDRTPWRNLEREGVGWDISLDAPDGFARCLARIVSMDEAEFRCHSQAAMAYGRRIAEDPNALEANRRLFVAAMGKARRRRDRRGVSR
jgi:glycosyltransferase involved in cell wall biosynthesis